MNASSDFATPTVGELLRTHGSRLTQSERKVVRVLQAEYPRAGLESLPTLARRADVSAPTVLRLLGKLGYQGYGDFQDALLTEVHEQMSQPASRSRRQSDLSDDEVGGGLADRARTLARTESKVDRTEFAEVVALLADTKRPVVSVGGFESEICSLHLVNLLGQVRANVDAVGLQARGAPSIALLDLGRRHVMVVFDYRRYQGLTLERARLAHERHAEIVLFTDRWISPVADLAKHVFVCDSESVGPFDSRASTIALIEVLVTAVTGAIGANAEKRMSKVYELLAGSTWAEGLIADGNGRTGSS